MTTRWIALSAVGLLLAGCGTAAASTGSPWQVHVTGTAGTTWQGGCETYTAQGTNNPTVNIAPPWGQHYAANVTAVNCYFQNQGATGTAQITIRYAGQVVASGSARGAYGILSAYGQAP